MGPADGMLTPATASLFAVPGGTAGVRRTLQILCDLVNQYKTDLNVRTLAVQLVQGCAPKDRRCELSTLQRFVRDQIRYVADVENVETVQTPVQTLKLRAGDCDDKATLLNALAAAIGFATRFCAIGVRGGPFSHVMAQARLGAGWINCETIVPGVEIGWFPPDATQGMLAHVS